MKHLFGYIFFITTLAYTNTASAQITNINGPSGSGQFGYSVTVLANGNFVVADPLFNDGPILKAGAVYLYDGSTYALISTLKGSSPNDSIGSNGVLALGNGNFVVISTKWDNEAATNAGAVTFGNGVTGVSGVVSSSNSLVGSSTNDNIGSLGVIDPIILNGGIRSGNYIVRSPLWDNGTAVNAGAITWGNGNTGVSGIVSSTNSLIGSSVNDNVGAVNVTSFGLSNTSLVLRSPEWDNGAAANAGAVTWFNGTTGIAGVISSSNSLVGTSAFDNVGLSGITILSNGNYVVRNPDWNNGAVVDAGAVTWGNGTTGITGAVSSTNSLVGSTTGNKVGSDGITVLNNGNYVVLSPLWDNGVISDAGAATWGNGNTGVTGAITSSNSLIGSLNFDGIGFNIKALSNGNYVVISPYWDNGAALDAGAATWGNGTTGITGPVNSSNSLVGSTTNDRVGNDDSTLTILTNGNYVVRSPNWDNGAVINAGAATWGNGTTGITGPVSSSNSLVGSSPNDLVSFDGIMALTNSNYIVRSTNWSDGAVTNVGAVTWGNGGTGISGTISSSNSLIGSTNGDNIGTIATALNNGNYVIGSLFWNNGVVTDAGAVTWGNGSTGTVGVVTSSNSLVGTSTNDIVGSISPLSNNNYLIVSSFWDNGVATDAGAVTWCSGSGPVSGVISSANSLIGSSVNDRIGSNLSISLSAGNYVVNSSNWDNGAIADAGAVSIGNSLTGITGVVSSSNSLVGSQANDRIGSAGVAPINNNVVVLSPLWDNGSATNAGAVTWINGAAITIGAVSSINSLVGSASGDSVGNNGLNFTNVTNPHYIFRSPNWDNGAISNAGAVTFGNGSIGVYGIITNCNSVPGVIAAGGSTLVSAFNNTYEYMLVGKRQENLVVIYNPAGMICANHSDTASTNINGTNKVPLIASGGCRIISSITPGGASPVNGTVNSKLWIEASVPTFAGIPFVSRHYEITPVTNTTTATGRITLYFLQPEFNDFNAHAGSILDLPTGPSDAIGKANLRIGKYSGTSSDGTGLPGTYTSGAMVINPNDADIIWNSNNSRWEVSFDVTGFSGFILQTNANVLPLTLLEFKCRLQNSNALLNWKTENETNTDRFNIERSTDGRMYAAVGSVNALNNNGINSYGFTDPSVTALGVPIVYYRLQKKDLDGKITYSKIIVLLVDDKKNMVLLYPNPVINELNLSVSINKPERVRGRIIDNTGRIIKQQQWNLTSGSTSLTIDVSSLANGIYYLKLKGETINERKQFVKQ
jgi:Repeat of unknown function (DUF5650)/Secretion system C-terminal sorting domain